MAKRRWQYLPEKERNEIIRRAAQGQSQRQIANEVGVTRAVVFRVLRPFGGVMLSDRVWSPGPGQLGTEDRIGIQVGLMAGWSFNRIGDELGRPGSTIAREVKRNGGRDGYKAADAHRAARQRAARPKRTKLEANPVLCGLVVEKLEQWWSPEEIANWLRRTFPDRPEMWVSHETIYKSLYVQGRGELRRELAACLRTGRAKRKQRGRQEHRGKISDMVMISDRPAEIEDRAVPGHWEGDLIIGKDGKSAVGTLVERSTRFVILLHLDGDRTAETVRNAMADAMAKLPELIRKSITWDQGREMAEHVQFTVDTGIPIYFCDPHSPWQRGSNENTNGLLRQYMPKGTDLSVHTPEDLERFALSLNTRPRKTLEWATPLEKLTELVMATAA